MNMTTLNKTLIILAIAAICTSAFGQNKLIGDVNVFVGTDGFGNVYPGAQLPYGGIQISPDCDDKDYDCAAGYKYSKPTVQGFSLTHLSGTGIPDLGDFLFLPGTTSDPKPSALDHSKEAAHPGYYGLTLDSGVKAEMTAAKRSGVFKFTYPEGSDAFVTIDIDLQALLGQVVYVQLGTDDFFPVVLTGDANGDGEVDVADATFILNVMADEADDLRADVNGDGYVDVADYTYVLNIMADE